MLLTQFAASRYSQWTSGKFFQAAIEKGLAQVELIRLALRSVANYFERLIALTREAEYIKASKSCRMSNRNSNACLSGLSITRHYISSWTNKKKQRKTSARNIKGESGPSSGIRGRIVVIWIDIESFFSSSSSFNENTLMMIFFFFYVRKIRRNYGRKIES